MAGLEARGQESAGGKWGAADTATPAAAAAAAAADATTPAAASSVSTVMRGWVMSLADICIHKKTYESDSMHGACHGGDLV